MLKLISEILPIAVFFISYKAKDILFATFVTLIVSIFHIIISYWITKKITIVQIIYATSLLFFGSITLWTGNSSFIKMKPTIFYCILSIIIFISDRMNKPVLKKILNDVIAFQEKYHWSNLSNRSALFYLLLAIANEIIWRNFSEIIWVRFKVFFVIPLIALFILLQIPYILKHNTKKKKN
ncbi:MAG: septation protein IspZ [Rickettsia sp.]|nr:septation protein IspZ [Rickettsia sp.]